MAMNFTITKDFGITKAQATAKARLTEVIMNALISEFGEENVAMVRTGSSTQVNEIGVRVGTITDNGFEFDFCSTLNPTMKSYKEKVTKRYTVDAFDFESARQNYSDWVTEKALEQEEKEKKKAEKIARDKKAREEKAKANAKAKEEKAE